ncbi:diacylglycerol/lipid kinase family protein [Desertibaculum subflavum]|uniref:diacylglycerol/lipid kinase family protein n=1 Tax=Desertibaculum subflavum TaxID=2268458 RepID=UPI000E66E030
MFHYHPRPVRAAVVTNPAAGRNRQDPAIERALARHPGIPRLVYRGGGELGAEVASLAAQGATDLIVDGGDGTVSAVTSAVLRLPPNVARPRLVLLPSGTTNLVALRLGVTTARVHAIDRILKTPAEALRASTVWQSPLQIEREGESEVLHGFLFGAAAFLDGTLLTRRRVNAIGLTRQLGIVGGIAANVFHATCGRGRTAFLGGAPITVQVDGSLLPGDRQFLLLLTALDRLLPWLSPFWGDGDGLIRWLNVGAPASGLIRALPRVLRGRPAPWMEASGYRSGRAGRIKLRTHRPFVLDGEVVQPGPMGCVTVRPGPPIAFLRLS